MDKDDYLKLYEMCLAEEHNNLEAHQTRVKFFSTLISGLFIAIVAGIIKAEYWYHYAALLIGPVLIFSISVIAKSGTFRLYQRFIESIIMRAKVEIELGFVNQRTDGSEQKWGKEPLVSFRHLESRNKFNTSKEFADNHKRTGYHKSTRNLFLVFQITSVIMFCFILIVLILESIK